MTMIFVVCEKGNVNKRDDHRQELDTREDCLMKLLKKCPAL